MPLYDHVFIVRQNLSNAQAEELTEHFGSVLGEQGGKVVASEYWGVKTMAYKSNEFQTGHFTFIRTQAPAKAVQEMERLVRLHDDVMRVLTTRVDRDADAPEVEMRASPESVAHSDTTSYSLGYTAAKSRGKAKSRPRNAPPPGKAMSVKWLVENFREDNEAVRAMLAEVENEAKNLRIELDASNMRVSNLISEIEKRH